MVRLPRRIISRGPHQVDRNHLSDKPAERTSGNLFEPAEGLASVSGGWLQDGQGSTGKWAASLALAAGAAAVAWWAQRSGALDEPLQSLRAKTSSSLASACSYATHAYAKQW